MSHPVIGQKLDTISLVGENAPLSRLLDLIDRCFNVQFDFTRSRSGARGMYYESINLGQLGLSLSFNKSTWDDTCMYRIVLPGKLLAATPLTATYGFLLTLRKMGARCTRFDWAIDDYAKRLSVADMQKMAEAGCYYGARSHMLYQSARKRALPTDIARTIYIGATDGTQRVCIYDKTVESNGEIDAIRIEYRYYDQKADYFFNRLLDNYKAGIPPNDISQCCVGRIGFTPSDNIPESITNLVELWAELVAALGEPIKTTFPKRPRTVEEKEAWIERQVIPTIAFLAKTIGFYEVMRWVKYLVSEAVSSMSKHKILESNYLLQWGNFVDDIANNRRGVMP